MKLQAQKSNPNPKDDIDAKKVAELTIKIRNLEQKYKDRVEENRQTKARTNLLQLSMDKNGALLAQKETQIRSQLAEL